MSMSGSAASPDHVRESRRRLLPIVMAALVAIAALALLWRFSPLHEMTQPADIAAWLRGLRDSPWLPAVIVGVYVVANALFFPNTVLNTATILGLGTTLGLPCALAGSLSAALVAYVAGRRYGRERLKALDSGVVDRITGMLRNSGVIAIASIRLLPIAPYNVVNLVAGAARVRAVPFTLGTLIGLLPGNLLVTAFGHQLRALLREPSAGQIALMLGVLAASGGWIWYARSR